ncbi:MAG: thiazole biosynthesis protein [Candidatus Krumholzibacteria bacterium]|nr:thiazole biosynthesis protein [Candidatus Krumholzibacteria bacterium]
MHLNEKTITEAIIKRYTEKLLDSLKCDVAIVGGGPSGLVAAAELAGAGWKTCLFERKLSIGGGMWGGGMMMNEIVVQEEGKEVLDEYDVQTISFSKGYYTADSVEAVSTICSKAVKAGVRIFNLISVEDILLRDKEAAGIVINWTAVELASLHVDPLTIESKFIIDSTGHAAEVIRVIEKKDDARLMTPSGKIEGERSLWADRAEQTTLENTREVFPRVYVAGMCANAVFGSYRMGPIFGGMLLSGKKVASLIGERLAEKR